MEVGESIRLLRKQKGLSQDELAQMTGYSSRSAISRIEAGERDLASGKIKLFADALEVSPSELIDYNSEFAKRLRKAMSISGLNQTKLSERTGICKSSLCHYMKGDWKPKQDAIHKIAVATGTKEGWLAGYEDDPQETENFVFGIGAAENPMIKELTNICRKLSTEKINALIAIARIL